MARNKGYNLQNFRPGVLKQTTEGPWGSIGDFMYTLHNRYYEHVQTLSQIRSKEQEEV